LAKEGTSEVKSLVEAKNVSPQRHSALIRSGICILYAHWEGFVKLASNSYLEYVAMQKLRYDQLSSNFLALAMKTKLNEARDTNKPSLYIPVCDFFLSNLNTKCSLPYQGKRILTGTKNMLQLNLTKFPCILLYFMDAINGKRF